MIAVITGAGRGIGQAVARELSRRGCDLALLGRTEARLSALADELSTDGRRALAIACDVSHEDAVERAAHRVTDELGIPGVVVCNAGIVHRGAVAETSRAVWQETLDVNLTGTFLTVRAFLPSMRARKKGRFVAISSISATMGSPRHAAYAASKWGQVGFMKSLAEELRGTGLTAMSVLPGSVDTDMLKGSGFSPAMSAEDVARTVAFVALDAPDAMNASATEMFGP